LDSRDERYITKSIGEQMTKTEKLLKDLDNVTDNASFFPKSYVGKMKKSKGFDRTEEGGDRNGYGNGWNDATMKYVSLITEILNKWESK
jgi:hypothetical protein